MSVKTVRRRIEEVVECHGIRQGTEIKASVFFENLEIRGGILVKTRIGNVATLNDDEAADLAEALVKAIIVRAKLDELLQQPWDACTIGQMGGVDVTRAEAAEYAARLFVSTKIVPLDDTVEADAQ